MNKLGIDYKSQFFIIISRITKIKSTLTDMNWSSTKKTFGKCVCCEYA